MNVKSDPYALLKEEWLPKEDQMAYGFAGEPLYIPSGQTSQQLLLQERDLKGLGRRRSACLLARLSLSLPSPREPSCLLQSEL